MPFESAVHYTLRLHRAPQFWTCFRFATQGDIAGAIRKYREAAERDPDHADAWTNLGSSHPAASCLLELISLLRS
jgi:tetratricopeptide (TPR) repeat protein